MINKFYKIIVLAMLLGILSGCTAMKAINLLDGGSVAKSPKESHVQFSLIAHAILVKARLNNSPKEYTFILDTGATTSLRKEVAKELKLPKGIEVEASGACGNSKMIDLVKLDSVTVGDMGVNNLAVGVSESTEVFPSYIAGLLGSNFLKHFKVTIDYRNKKITLSQKTKPIALKKNEIQVPFTSDVLNGFVPEIECVIDGNIDANGMIDTGANGIVGLPISMMEQTRAFKEGLVSRAKGGMGVGMFGTADKSMALRISEMKIGDLKLTNIPATTYAGENTEVLLGKRFLEKFLVTLNYPEGKMTLKPYGTPFETNMPTYGFSLIKKEGKTIVLGIWKNSQAEKKNIHPGDEIIKINSIKTSNLSFFEMLAIVSSKNMNTIELEIKNGKERKKVILHKKMLLPEIHAK